jgi:hypothetical protein
LTWDEEQGCKKARDVGRGWRSRGELRDTVRKCLDSIVLLWVLCSVAV